MTPSEPGSDSRAPSLVLVVDDDEDMLELTASALEFEGYRVHMARHGLEALERIREEEPHVILLDMRMPVMDGWTFARVLREQHPRRIPIVVVTAAEDPKKLAADVGADEHLGKPFELDQLVDVIERSLPAA